MIDDLPSGADLDATAAGVSAAAPDFGILLMLAARAYADDLHARLAAVGFPEMRASFGFVFRVLRQSAPTPSDLAARLGVSKQAASKVLDEMEARGLVVRETDPHDRRARRVALTERGRAVSDAAVRFSDQIEADLMRAVGGESVDALRSALLAYVSAHGDGAEARERRARPTW